MSVALARNARLRHMRLLKKVQLTSPGSLKQAGIALGPQLHDLPPNLLWELLCPGLQALHRPYFENLQLLGDQIIDLHCNEDLGTQGVKVVDRVLDQFVENRKIGSLLVNQPADPIAARNLLTSSVGAVHLHLGPQKSKEMVYSRLLNGHQGLSWLYLQALGHS